MVGDQLKGDRIRMELAGFVDVAPKKMQHAESVPVGPSTSSFVEFKTRERNKMAEAVSKSRKSKVEVEKSAKFVPSPSATTPHPREELITPPFSVQELRDCIPAHCFERSNLTSFTYLAVDILIVSFFFVVGAWLHFKANMPFWLALLVWPVYALVQVRTLFYAYVPHGGQNCAFSLQRDSPLLY